jgi:NTE family protein
MDSMMHWMNEQEAKVDLVLHKTEPDQQVWNQCCLRQSDAVLMIVDTETSAADQLPSEMELLLQTERQRRELNGILALFHSEHALAPAGTANWQKRLNPRRCIHLRQNNWSDMQRLTRFIQGRAIGLVLAGGGARGLVHLGIYKALEEKGIPIDIVGGASAGSIVGGILAMDLKVDAAFALLKEMAAINPTKRDTDLLPFVSLIRGKKLKKALHYAYQDRNIEDLWREFFCVSSNMSKVELSVHREGNLAKAVRASVAIPGVFPPVIYGNDIHVDGGVMSNLPVETMRDMGASRIIAVDFDTDRDYELNYDEIPSSAVLLRQRITGQIKYRVPSIVNILMNSIVLSSDSQARRLSGSVDLFFRPDVKTIGFIQWEAYQEAVDIGYQYASKALEGIDAGDWV